MSDMREALNMNNYISLVFQHTISFGWDSVCFTELYFHKNCFNLVTNKLTN